MTFPAADAAFDDPRLNGRARRVYRVAMADLDFRRFRRFTLLQLARKTTLDKADCSRARSRLVKYGYLERRKQDGRSHGYRLVYSFVGTNAK